MLKINKKSFLLSNIIGWVIITVRGVVKSITKPQGFYCIGSLLGSHHHLIIFKNKFILSVRSNYLLNQWNILNIICVSINDNNYKVTVRLFKDSDCIVGTFFRVVWKESSKSSITHPLHSSRRIFCRYI